MPLIDPATGAPFGAPAPPVGARPDVRRVDLFTGRIANGRSYFLSDQRVSGGTIVEADVWTCPHCNCGVLPNPRRERPSHVCLKCNARTCGRPGCVLECNPIAESIDLALRHTDRGPFVTRSADGGLLFDPTLRDQTRIH